MSFSLIRTPKGSLRIDNQAGVTLAWGDGQHVTRADLRDSIPASLLLALITEAAVTGLKRQICLQTGEEVGPALPVDVKTQLDLAEKLLNRRLPAYKPVDIASEAQEPIDLDNLPSNPEDVKRMTLTQLVQIREAQFEAAQKESEEGDDHGAEG